MTPPTDNGPPLKRPKPERAQNGERKQQLTDAHNALPPHAVQAYWEATRGGKSLCRNFQIGCCKRKNCRSLHECAIPSCQSKTHAAKDCPPPASSRGIFGATPESYGCIFGAPTASSGSSFSGASAGGIFGAPPASSGSIFGVPAASSSSIFSALPAASGASSAFPAETNAEAITESAVAAPTPANPYKPTTTMFDKVAAIKKELNLDADITLKAAVEQANLTMGIKAVGSMADQVAELISELGINPTAAPARKRPFANF